MLNRRQLTGWLCNTTMAKVCAIYVERFVMIVFEDLEKIHQSITYKTMFNLIISRNQIWFVSSYLLVIIVFEDVEKMHFQIT